MGFSFPPFNSSCVESSSQMGLSFFCNWELGVLVSGMGSASAHCPPGISPLVREKSHLSPPRSDFLMISNPSSKRRCLKLSLYPTPHAFISSFKVLKCYWILFSICIRVFPLIDENVNVILCVTTFCLDVRLQISVGLMFRKDEWVIELYGEILIPEITLVWILWLQNDQ